ncbi:AAA domain-containing protein [Halanaerobium sp. MA284_MarDTE_T2]
MNRVDKALKKGKVSLLDIQYRMAPQIADISNRFFYNNISSCNCYGEKC